jgi:hypothetical protein
MRISKKRTKQSGGCNAISACRPCGRQPWMEIQTSLPPSCLLFLREARGGTAAACAWLQPAAWGSIWQTCRPHIRTACAVPEPTRESDMKGPHMAAHLGFEGTRCGQAGPPCSNTSQFRGRCPWPLALYPKPQAPAFALMCLERE